MTTKEAEAMGNTQDVGRVSHITVPRCPYCGWTTLQKCYGTVKCEGGSKMRYYRCGNCHHPAIEVGGPNDDNHTRYKATVG